jgi:hypothetical protein
MLPVTWFPFHAPLPRVYSERLALVLIVARSPPSANHWCPLAQYGLPASVPPGVQVGEANLSALTFSRPDHDERGYGRCLAVHAHIHLVGLESFDVRVLLDELQLRRLASLVAVVGEGKEVIGQDGLGYRRVVPDIRAE